MSVSALRRLAAYHTLGLARTGEVIDAANNAINNGIYTHSLGELIYLRNPIWSDVLPLLTSAITELGIDSMTVDDAAETIVTHELRPIVEGVASPARVLDRLYQAFLMEMLYKPGIHFHGERFRPLEQFIRQIHSYEELEYWTQTPVERADATARLDCEVVRAATELCYSVGRARLNLAWLTSTVVTLAMAIDADRAFDRLPILADALEEAGCDDPDVLEHCRCESPHIRSCWVLNLILGVSLPV